MNSQNLLSLFFILSISIGCGGGNIEEALNADTTDESASDLISFFENADPNLKKLAKNASDALDQDNYAVAVQSINQLRANGARLTTEQFMVISEAGVNIQNAMIEAAEKGDKKAQTILNMQSAGRRN
ncbi:MAG: hypothetical protein EVA72_10020 [Limisphaerales bacterium]|nr:MAG: hypothetical protein EVA72_10020 [Limisphaerales bacterium]|tara:strand:+ start:1160 stop:1543 length:384 start_codon:yes stop_codon:yes gene_type:complete